MSDKFWEELEKAMYRSAIKQAKLEKDVEDIEKERYALYFTKDEMEKLYRMLLQLQNRQYFFDKDIVEFYFELIDTIQNKLGIE